MSSILFAVNDGLVRGEANGADLLFLIAAILFAVVTYLHLSAKAIEAGLTTLAFCLVAVAWLIL